MNKRTKEQFVPRHNYITLTCDRVGVPEVYDENSNISEYQTVLNVGPHVIGIVPGDKIKFERTAFPSHDVAKDPDLQTKLNELNKVTQERLDKLHKSKGKAADKKLKEDEMRLEFQEAVQKLQETVKIFTIPVVKDDLGEDFLWMADRAVMFKFND